MAGIGAILSALASIGMQGYAADKAKAEQHAAQNKAKRDLRRQQVLEILGQRAAAGGINPVHSRQTADRQALSEAIRQQNDKGYDWTPLVAAGSQLASGIYGLANEDSALAAPSKVVGDGGDYAHTNFTPAENYTPRVDLETWKPVATDDENENVLLNAYKAIGR